MPPSCELHAAETCWSIGGVGHSIYGTPCCSCPVSRDQHCYLGKYIISQLAVAIENLGDYALDVFPYGLAREYDAHIYCYDGTIPNLKGAVPDAEAIREFILDELDVPQSQITILLNSQATRSAIIGAIQHLAVNPAIQRGDAILIYYAGHGSAATAPENWHTEDGKIEMLVPVDCGIKDIHGIPDKTIQSLITKVANNKGDNITVIFDCCHSGSGTRGDSSVISTRGIAYEKEIPKDLDAKLLAGDGNTRGVKLAAGFLNHGLESHIHFAACNSYEVAREANGRGAFTTALLAALATVCTDKISYTDLLSRIDALPMQNPRCEGVKQHRFLFDSKAPPRRRTVYNVKTQGNELIIQAGVIHGVTIGATFELWESLEACTYKLECLGTVTVSQIAVSYSSASSLSHPKRDKTPTLAIQVVGGKKQVLHLYAPREVSCVWEAVLKHSAVPSSQHMEIVLSDRGAAEISAVAVGNKIAFDTHDPRVTQYGLSRLSKTVDQDVNAIHSVLCGVAHYSYHFRRTNVTPPKFDGVPLGERIVVELFRLRQGEIDDNGNRGMVPDGANLNVPGAGIDLVVDDASYGFKIINNSPLDLYPYFFFFDNCDLSISSLYQPPSTGEHTADPPLKKGQELPIGYGSGGHAAHQYTINDPTQNLEVGFLKLFISSTYVDFSEIEQESPFRDASLAMKKAKVSPPRFWDVIFIPFILRRPAKPRLTFTSADCFGHIYCDGLSTTKLTSAALPQRASLPGDSIPHFERIQERLRRLDEMDLSKFRILLLENIHQEMWAELPTMGIIKWDDLPWPVFVRTTCPEDLMLHRIVSYLLQVSSGINIKEALMDSSRLLWAQQRLRILLRHWGQPSLQKKVENSADKTMIQGVNIVMNHLQSVLDFIDTPQIDGTHHADLTAIISQTFLKNVGESLARILTDTSDNSGYKSLLRLKGNSAQKMLNFLQTLLDCSELVSLPRNDILGALLPLSKLSKLYPECLTITDLERDDHVMDSGHFGEIYKGYSRNQAICLKIIKVNRKTEINHLLKAFLKEALLWGHLSHPNILSFYGIYHLKDTHGRISFVSPWMENGNVTEYLKKHPLTNRLFLISDIILGIQFLHQNQVIHGDLKGLNVLVNRSGRCCLADFGLANLVDEDILHWTSIQTTRHQISGTLRWQAPELIDPPSDESAKATPASDIYSFACVCYEIYTGHVPFYKIRDIQVMKKVVEGSRPPRPANTSLLSNEIWKVIEMCWNQEPQDRPSAESVIEQLPLAGIVDDRPSGDDHLAPSDFRSAGPENLGVVFDPEVDIILSSVLLSASSATLSTATPLVKAREVSPSPSPCESPRPDATPKLPGINGIPEGVKGQEESAQSPPSLLTMIASLPTARSPRSKRTTTTITFPF